MLKKLLSGCVCAVLSAVMLTSCGRKAGDVASIKKHGNLVVYTSPDFPPYEFIGEEGKAIGCEIAILEKVASKLGVKLEVKPAQFDSIIMAIASGKADLGASGFTITDERKQQVDFTVPFDRSYQYLILREEDNYKYLEDLAGKAIGGQVGNTGMLLVEDAINKGELKDTKAELKQFKTASDAVLELKNKKLDAVVVDKLVAIELSKQNEGTKTVQLLFKTAEPEHEDFGMIVKKGNAELLQLLNATITEMKESGELEVNLLKYSEIARKLQDK